VYERVLSQLFTNAPGGPASYAAAFLDCLQRVFLNVAETYVRLITGDLDEGEIVEQKAIRSAIQHATEVHQSVSADELERGLTAFLTESNPDYDSIKWNMTQNYYLLKALGWDAEGYLLTRSMFENAMLYLDTNVLFPALEPRSSHYRNFEAVSRACRQLGIQLRVTQFTLNELRGVVTYARFMIDKVEDQIPEDLAERVNNVLYQAYVEARRGNAEVDLNEVFASFESVAESLAESHDVELVDDLWFDDHRSSPDITQLAESIRRQYSERRPDREKSEGAAIHDALVLAWVENERAREERPVWLVTLDTSLPAFVPDPSEQDRRPLAITLDALLQWIWPFAAESMGDGELSQMFAEALKLHLLPRERFLDLRDFEVLADFRLSCKELPAEDVEECIRLIKRKAPSLDLTSSVGREQLAYELARFFAAPGRRYKREVERLEAVVREHSEQLDAADEGHQEELERVKGEFEAQVVELREEMERRDSALTKSLNERDETIGRLTDDVQAERERAQTIELRSSARARVGIGFAVWIVLVGIVVWISLRYGSGANVVGRLQDGWPWLLAATGAAVLFTVLLLGKERLRILGWRTRRVLGDKQSG
jgi:hypothetical protein